MKKVTIVVTLALIMITAGCASSGRQAPHMGFGKLNIEAQIGREDLVVMRSVEGTSSEKNYFGLWQIVDGSKLQILGIPFFKDKITYWDKNNRILNRAYYKALEAVPDADVIFEKSYNIEKEGMFLIGTKTVTVKGKAMKLKAD